MQGLVAYASADGSTKGIAERIATRLTVRGHHVVVSPVDRCHDVDSFDAVVVGSAVHGRQWLEEASDFVNAHRGELSERPLWAFSVGMPDALPRVLRGMARTEEAAIAAHLESLHPRGHHLFSGVVDPKQFPFSSRVFLRLMGAQYGDFRDWQEIDRWAGEISHALAPAPTPS